ncbi:MAG: two-component system, OmpR family, phosphate regulon sensor histidine kinase PhoR, partial [Acidobacteriaceae bacterium]|nr:two-component system, OmpR family, phosphate regulon sensor histidine kinase PhoR [Acidobacteriaceae bacterium]
MLKLQVGRWSERPRMLVLMLAVMVPAAALIVASVWHLRDIQRKKEIEAVIQRDYQQVLALAEKRIDERAYRISEEIRDKFPDADQPDELETFLTAHPNVSHAFLWTGKGRLDFQSQPGQMDDPEFHEESKALSSDIATMFDSEARVYLTKLKKMEAGDGPHVYIGYDWVLKGDKMQYVSTVFFRPRGSTAEHPALAGFVYDPAYMANTFFPQALNEVVPDEGRSDPSHPQPALMVRTAKDQTPLAASACWDGERPEVERTFDGIFPGMILGIGLHGTTIADISRRFARQQFLILGALSLLMGAGMVLTYRNVSRELALAKLKSDFVSNVSHELRTPLALIRLYAETLELGRISNPGKHQEYYEIIRKESERLTSLINNILDFSRIEAGKKEYSFSKTDVGDLVRTTLESYRFEIEHNGFRFEQKIANDLPPLQVDREAIARSLLNLVNNAVKYSATEKYLGVHLYHQ